jgi:hypothetical protein
MGFSLISELPSELGVGALKTGPLLCQLVNVLRGLFQLGGLLLGFPFGLLHISEGLI